MIEGDTLKRLKFSSNIMWHVDSRIFSGVNILKVVYGSVVISQTIFNNTSPWNSFKENESLLLSVHLLWAFRFVWESVRLKCGSMSVFLQLDFIFCKINALSASKLLSSIPFVPSNS